MLLESLILTETRFWLLMFTEHRSEGFFKQWCFIWKKKQTKKTPQMVSPTAILYVMSLDLSSKTRPQLHPGEGGTWCLGLWEGGRRWHGDGEGEAAAEFIHQQDLPSCTKCYQKV